MASEPSAAHEEPSLSAADIAEITARCEQATAGPWKSWVERRDGISGSDFIETGGEDIYLTGATTADQDIHRSCAAGRSAPGGGGGTTAAAARDKGSRPLEGCPPPEIAPSRESGFPLILISSYSTWLARGEAMGPSRVVSIMGADTVVETPRWLPSACHLRLTFDDVIDSSHGYKAPARKHIARLIEFTKGWTEDGPILVHCMAGISRSSAAALIVASSRRPGREVELARRLRRAGPWVSPNERMVALADDLLRCDGRLRRALEAMGAPTARVGEGPARLDLT
jgi:predicted protein tyrosine phosphatase